MTDLTLFAPTQTERARRNFLARYKGGTLGLYELDLRVYFDWCRAEGLEPLSVRRPDLEAFIHWMMTKTDRPSGARSAGRRFQTVRSFLRLAAADGYIERDPTFMVRVPKWTVDESKIAWLTPIQVAKLQEAARQTSPAHVMLVEMMATLGLRVSEACAVRIENLIQDDSGYTVLPVRRKGGKVTVSAIPIPMLQLIEAARAERTEGPLIVTRAGGEQTRNGAYDWIKRLCKKAGLPQSIHPHSLRHTFVTTLVDAGLPIQEVQKSAGHADIRQTEWYYRRNLTPDQHGSHVASRMYAAAA